MNTEHQNIKNINITDELAESYLDYSMSVIVGRALPDVRDGLKPVHRRILWAMHDSGLTSQAKYKKSANVVGEVLGKYHPHGDVAVYDSMVRMAQDFSMRYPLIDGQGNFGSVDGDNAAAMRYTEARLSKIASELLVDIEKETVNWQPNYDSSREEPMVLPAKLPNLLINGSSGIAVGMATTIPPHNISEVIDATIELIKNPELTNQDLTKFIQGPDFPTGGVIYDRKAIAEAYAIGRGAITMRAVCEIKEIKSNQFSIIVSEIPYQVNKSELLIKIADLVGEKKIEGIRDVRDESDRDGLRVVVDLKTDVSPQKILNQLFKFTDLQKNFNLNMVALAQGIQPRLMGLKDILEAYIEHRKEVVRRRAEFDLKKARERAHILEGLAIALDVIDEVIATIKKSKDTEEAHQKLVAKFKLSLLQATAILEMKLRTLAALERQRIEEELAEKRRIIKELESLLQSPEQILDVIKEEILEIKKTHGDARRTKIVSSGLKEFKEEDLIPQEEVIITLSHGGYIKRVPSDSFKIQNRGGSGLIGSDVSEEDFLTHFVSAETHDNILFFTDRGRVFQTKVYEIPPASRTSKGRAIHNFLEISTEEKISAIIAYPDSGKSKSKFLVMATKKGVIKKTAIKDFANIRRTGIIAINLKQGDLLGWVGASSGKDEIIFSTTAGQSVRFSEDQVRAMGRTSAGVTAVRLKAGDTVSSMNIIDPETSKEAKVLVVMQNGFGKQTLLEEYRLQNRGGSGIKTADVTAKTGPVIDSVIITNQEEILALSAKGQIIRTKLDTIRTAGRQTQGVKIMNIKPGDKLSGIVCL